MTYQRLDGEISERILRPLGLAFIPPIWLLTSWCELRGGFRNFRVERISAAERLEARFEEEAGRTMEDYLERVRAHEA